MGNNARTGHDSTPFKGAKEQVVNQIYEVVGGDRVFEEEELPLKVQPRALGPTALYRLLELKNAVDKPFDKRLYTLQRYREKVSQAYDLPLPDKYFLSPRCPTIPTHELEMVLEDAKDLKG